MFETVVQFHCLNSYQNKVVSKRLAYLIGSQSKVSPAVLCTFHPDPRMWDCNLTVYAKTHPCQTSSKICLWDPYRQDQIDKIEADQRRAARFIRRDYDWNSRVYRERCFRRP